MEECIFRPNGKSCSPRKEKSIQTSTKMRMSLDQSFDFKGPPEDIWLGFSAKPETQAYENITQILIEEKMDLNKNDTLPPEALSKAICFLTQQIERYIFVRQKKEIILFYNLGCFLMLHQS